MDFYGLSLRPSVVKGIKWNYEKYQNMSKLPYNDLFYPQMTINKKKNWKSVRITHAGSWMVCKQYIVLNHVLSEKMHFWSHPTENVSQLPGNMANLCTVCAEVWGQITVLEVWCPHPAGVPARAARAWGAGRGMVQHQFFYNFMLIINDFVK